MLEGRSLAWPLSHRYLQETNKMLCIFIVLAHSHFLRLEISWLLFMQLLVLFSFFKGDIFDQAFGPPNDGFDDRQVILDNCTINNFIMKVTFFFFYGYFEDILYLYKYVPKIYYVLSL